MEYGISELYHKGWNISIGIFVFQKCLNCRNIFALKEKISFTFLQIMLKYTWFMYEPI